MKTFKTLRRDLEEHPSVGARILDKINPLDKLKDKMDNLKPGKLLDKMKKKLDKINPLSQLNKANTERIKNKIGKLKDKKKNNTEKNKNISKKIDTLKSRIAP
jgi:methyl-accepting chemotaxis protein